MRRRADMKWGLRKQRIFWGYVFMSPWLLGTAILLLWPLGRSLLLSFQKMTDIVGLQTEWLGPGNYVEAFREDVEFLPRLLGSMQELAINLPLILVFSVVMALLVARVQRGQTFLRAVFFLPVVIGSAGVITEMLRAGAGEEVVSGTTAPLLAAMGESADASSQAIIAPIQAVVNRLTLILWHTGVQILLFVAGLNSVSPSMYEAAQVDGASSWESFWKITLPMLSPVILVAAIYTIVDSFTDPLNAVVDYIMQVSIELRLRLDYGAALGWLYFAFIFVIILVLLQISKRMVFYMGERQ